jgi:hypothetical protein
LEDLTVSAVNEGIGKRWSVAPATGFAGQRVSDRRHPPNDNAASARRQRRIFAAFDEVPDLWCSDIDETIVCVMGAAFAVHEKDYVHDTYQRVFAGEAPAAIAVAGGATRVAPAYKHCVGFAAAFSGELESRAKDK